MQSYHPTERFKDVHGLVRNHYRFQIDALPDLTFFTQAVHVPSVTGMPVNRATPLAIIKETPSKLTFGSLNLTYLVDAKFKTYYSIYWWMKGYGFPHSNEEVASFRLQRSQNLARPIVRELEKTHAVLSLLEPDTERTFAEIRFTDVFPISLGELTFTAAEGEASPYVTTTASFEFTEFDVFLLDS